jgi:hypothetical protein
MKRLLVFVLLLAVSAPSLAGAQATAARSTTPALKYGANPAAGRTFAHDGVTLYYEVYGAGEPILLVHGNGGSIADLGAQIDHFRKRYRHLDSRACKAGISTYALPQGNPK